MRPAPPTGSTHFCFITDDGERVVVDAAAYRRERGVSGLLRSDPLEYAKSKEKDVFWYFNLGLTTHQVGGLYLPVPVLRAGIKAEFGRQEQLPLLGRPESRIFKAIHVRWEPLIDTFGDVLEPSLLETPTLQELEKSLLRRYGPALNASAWSQLASRGVTATRFELAHA